MTTSHTQHESIKVLLKQYNGHFHVPRYTLQSQRMHTSEGTLRSRFFGHARPMTVLSCCSSSRVGHLFFLRFYLFIHDGHRETERGRDTSTGRSREPDTGLDPRTPGSYPGPKAAAKLLSHPGIPRKFILIRLGDQALSPLYTQIWIWELTMITKIQSTKKLYQKTEHLHGANGLREIIGCPITSATLPWFPQCMFNYLLLWAITKSLGSLEMTSPEYCFHKATLWRQPSPHSFHCSV